LWQIGSLGLTDSEEDDIVAFLQTLTDGYDAAGSSPALNYSPMSDSRASISASAADKARKVLGNQHAEFAAHRTAQHGGTSFSSNLFPAPLGGDI
jgi:hypothetical protein